MVFRLWKFSKRYAVLTKTKRSYQKKSHEKMTSVDHAARKKATWLRVKTLYDVLREELARWLLDSAKVHVDCVCSCDRPYFMLTDVANMCHRVFNKHPDLKSNHPSDMQIVDALLTFKSRGQSSRHLTSFSNVGIKIPLVQHLVEVANDNRMTVFNVSDPEKSSKIFLQVVLDPNVEKPFPNPTPDRKRSRLEFESWSPTSPQYD